MPELPEVETIVNDLAPYVVGRSIVKVTAYDTQVLPQGLADFERRLTGRRIEGLCRRAKYTVADLSGGERLVVHLRMTGRLVLRSPGAPEGRFTRLALTLDDGQELRYADPRQLGRLWVMKAAEWAARESRLGPEPLSEAFTPDVLAAMLGHRRGAIKPLLLDQSFLAGIGNIYADEVLFEARLHPLRAADSLSPAEVVRLHAAIRLVLQRAIANRGTTFSDYRDGLGRPGRNQLALAVYQRQGKPCPGCDGVVKRVRIGGRGTYFCPTCQV
ncbi:MAG: bifunctional DNA-formamidopyrimidine glycosylase/DNA-(apurinic or apyrimidinic site) lyase [Chloroflexi bacterium]|nr:bifunctional DNA-formamidopyrimidine glycosylase/DNA-(apurinic or apyrimidinic site) lyase [Chloroflexota bacterium]MCL5026578.1 bifunctional DNA-formamidopyrimidine glycosylase/DNA-(apurinic or apyrimidinic site) lyase [Chloroflexota bacterium]